MPATREASKEFAAFKADEGNHLKLLFCIDMLNEGVHVEGISGGDPVPAHGVAHHL